MGHEIDERLDVIAAALPILVSRLRYNVDCPTVADNPPLNAERHATTFLGYLEIALRSGGFPGLEICKEHNWPVEKLSAGLLASG